MSSTMISPEANLTTDIVNTILKATKETFETMLDCHPVRQNLGLKTSDVHLMDVSAVIGLSGDTTGTICLSFSQEMAFQTVYRLIEVMPEKIDPIVCDTVGEFANVVAGSAKHILNQSNTILGLPSVVWGEGHEIEFPTSSHPMYMEFDSELGPFMIQFGFVKY